MPCFILFLDATAVTPVSGSVTVSDVKLSQKASFASFASFFDSFAWIIFYVQTEALLTHGPIQAEARTEGGSMIKLWRKYPETESWTRPPAMLSLTDLRWTN